METVVVHVVFVGTDAPPVGARITAFEAVGLYVPGHGFAVDHLLEGVHAGLPEVMPRQRAIEREAAVTVGRRGAVAHHGAHLLAAFVHHLLVPGENTRREVYDGGVDDPRHGDIAVGGRLLDRVGHVDHRMQQVVAVGDEHRDINGIGFGLERLGFDGRTLHRGERRHDGHVLDRNERHHEIPVFGEEFVGLQFVGPAHDLGAGGIFLDDVLVICALVMILDVEEIGEQAVGNHVVLVGCAPALLEIGSHVRPGESHVAVGRPEIVFHEPVDTLDVGLEHPAQIPDHRETISLHLLVKAG